MVLNASLHINHDNKNFKSLASNINESKEKSEADKTANNRYSRVLQSRLNPEATWFVTYH
jgi:hypothetical protein